MGNVYLEKIAANKFKAFQQSQGHDFTGMTNAQVMNNHRLGGNTGDTLSKGNLSERLATRKAGNFVPDNKTVQLPRGITKEKKGLFGKTVTRVNSSVGGQTANSAMRNPAAKATTSANFMGKVKDLAGKAKGLAMAHPGKLALGAGALALGARALRSNTNEQPYNGGY